MANVNRFLAEEAAGLENPITFAGANTVMVQQLIDLISLEATQPDEHRLFLDEMSPACRNSLYVILVAMKGEIADV